MARYTDPACRQCRRIGEKLFLKGDRCYTSKCGVERRKRPPGDQIPRRRRLSDWAMQLREKQKARFTYGVLERQFLGYYKIAKDQSGSTGDILLQLLETRLDNVVFRLSFVDSRRQARQLINHGHLTVNGKRMDIPSYIVKSGDKIEWKADFLQVFAGKLDYNSYSFLDRIMIKLIMLITNGPTKSKEPIEFTEWERVNDFGIKIIENFKNTKHNNGYK